MNIEQLLHERAVDAVSQLYASDLSGQLQIQKTRKEFEGDYTLVVFPILRQSKKSPEVTASEIGQFMVDNSPEIEKFNVVKGFLNLFVLGRCN